MLFKTGIGAAKKQRVEGTYVEARPEKLSKSAIGVGGGSRKSLGGRDSVSSPAPGQEGKEKREPGERTIPVEALRERTLAIAMQIERDVARKREGDYQWEDMTDVSLSCSLSFDDLFLLLSTSFVYFDLRTDELFSLPSLRSPTNPRSSLLPFDFSDLFSPTTPSLPLLSHRLLHPPLPPLAPPPPVAPPPSVFVVVEEVSSVWIVVPNLEANPLLDSSLPGDRIGETLGTRWSTACSPTSGRRFLLREE